MQCGRCEGMLVCEPLTDIFDETGKIQCEGWRCINCGDITDPLIRYHRVFGQTVEVKVTDGRRAARLRIAV